MSIFREHKTVADRSASDRRRHKQKIDKAIQRAYITSLLTKVSSVRMVRKSSRFPYEASKNIALSMVTITTKRSVQLREKTSVEDKRLEKTRSNSKESQTNLALIKAKNFMTLR